MRKSGILLKATVVVALSVLMIVLSISAPTFSWFDRAQTLKGDGLKYELADTDNVIGYDGKDVSITTYFSPSGENESYQMISPPDPQVHTSGVLAPKARRYYETVIHNNGSSEQNVSLYISDLKTTGTSGELCVGVNTPVKAYRNFTEQYKSRSAVSTTGTAGDRIRVYFQPQNANKWNGANGGYVIHYYLPNKDDYTPPMAVTGEAGTLYTDIPVNTEKFYIKINNADGDEAWGRTPDIKVSELAGENRSDSNHPGSLHANAECVFTLTEQTSTENSYGNAGYNVYSVNGANIYQYYSAASMSLNDSADLHLTIGTDYIGNNISYSSSDTNVFTVSLNGRVYAEGVGTAKLKTTVYSQSYLEAYEVETTITVSNPTTNDLEIADAPILTNIKVPAGDKVSVKWFIMNDPKATGNVSYTLSNVYLGL